MQTGLSLQAGDHGGSPALRSVTWGQPEAPAQVRGTELLRTMHLEGAWPAVGEAALVRAYRCRGALGTGLTWF